MIYGVFSDVHGNYQALKAVVEKFEQLGVEEYIFCGDAVGYGPQPNECIELLRTLPKLHYVVGNHDLAALGLMPIEWFNESAGNSIKISCQLLTQDSMDFLRKAKTSISDSNFYTVHGSPSRPYEEYVLHAEQFVASQSKWEGRVCFMGHTHTTIYMKARPGRYPIVSFLNDGEIVDLNSEYRYMINPGSVGQPRDLDPRASCAIYDSEKNKVQLCRVSYSMHETQDHMRRLNLPESLISRIKTGS